VVVVVWEGFVPMHWERCKWFCRWRGFGEVWVLVGCVNGETGAKVFGGLAA